MLIWIKLFCLLLKKLQLSGLVFFVHPVRQDEHERDVYHRHSHVGEEYLIAPVDDG